jgi:3-oxoadipate enol-lactonase
MAKDALSLLENLHVDRCDVVGISMGGMIAQEIALKQPERVRKLVLINTYAKPLNSIREFIRKNYSNELIRDLKKEKVVDFFLGLVISDDFRKENPDVVEAIKENYAKQFSKIGFINQLAATQMHDTSKRLKSLKAETLIIAANDDKLIPPRASKLLSEKIPGANFISILRGSHTVHWEMDKEFNNILRGFLGS